MTMNKFTHIENEKLIIAQEEYKQKDYLSVTKLTGKLSEDGIAEWRRKVGDEVADRIMKNASERGLNIHNLIEDYLNNKEIMIPENAIDHYYTFKAMKPELNKINNIQGLELKMFSDEYKLKGRCDCFAEYDGKLSMIDFKTSKKIKKKSWLDAYFIQATAYCEMVREHTNLEIDNIVLIFGITDYNTCKIESEKPQNFLKELIRINNEYNS